MSTKEYKKSEGVTTIRMPQYLLDSWNAKVERLAMSRPKQVRQWVERWIVEDDAQSEPGEEEFTAAMRIFYRRATEAEREMLLQIADPKSLMERQRQAAERAMARLDADKAS